MPISTKDSTPPPTIGKIGPYTVFVTPPATPTTPKTAPAFSSPPTQKVSSPVTPPPPAMVQPPPQQFPKAAAGPSPSDGSVLGFFRDAVVKVQKAHSSLDEYVAHWFGLNQSKYQWALDDYYETKGADHVEAKAGDISGRA